MEGAWAKHDVLVACCLFPSASMPPPIMCHHEHIQGHFETGISSLYLIRSSWDFTCIVGHSYTTPLPSTVVIVASYVWRHVA